MVKIKICGVKRLKDIEIINKYNPDYIGFVFAKSKRQITHELAKQLKDKLNPNIKTVGVFVDAPQEEILKLYNDKIISIAQLHGNEDVKYINDLKNKTNNELEIIKAVEITTTTNLLEYENLPVDYLLLDSGKGSGKTFNWDLIKQKLNKKYFIAGGLDKTNIKKAIKTFNPYGVDLSSSLETNEFKDEEKIKEIMEIIK